MILQYQQKGARYGEVKNECRCGWDASSVCLWPFPASATERTLHLGSLRLFFYLSPPQRTAFWFPEAELQL